MEQYVYPFSSSPVVTHTQTGKKKIMDVLLQYAFPGASKMNMQNWSVKICDYDLCLMINIMIFRYQNLESGCVLLFISDSQIDPYR
jgi:hypothetical protein